MNRRSGREQARVQVSELITLRDDIRAAGQMLAGRANALGFAMRVPEHTQRHLRIVGWVKASLSPFSLLTQSFTTVLQRLRETKTTTTTTKRLMKATEELVFWGSVLDGLAKVITATTPLGAAFRAADVAGSLALKAKELSNLDKIAAIQKAMDYYWDAAQRYQRLCPLVVTELNREIDRWLG